ncbi:phosphoribosylglycinamide formyltransferase [Chryseolinea sp. H1M3-3]|uniref:phosphoribosylglycinamide formyltransferase n=1 Tax=Chryseolinea sp. H1M3-3 TaxID=3034144 RepID=UPI0023EBD292|nr:phosphoribosylglycinamide formyltransferase [Chryseolinea sp. H1M3-3]
MIQQFRIAIFASGSGTNAEAIVSYFKNHPSIEVALILSNNPNAFVLERAKKLNIPWIVFNREQFHSSILSSLKEHEITHIVLAGFLWLVPPALIAGYPGKIINIHPALLPKYGGKGMYGMKIHELIRSSNETETGITIHLINEKYDEGPVLFQGKCEVTNTDTPEQIAMKVHQLEHTWYPQIIEKWILGEKK